jgi:hypothetical protein
MESPFEDRELIGCEMAVGVVGFDCDGVFEAAEWCPTIGIGCGVITFFEFFVNVEIHSIHAGVGYCDAGFDGDRTINDGVSWESLE